MAELALFSFLINIGHIIFFVFTHRFERIDIFGVFAIKDSLQIIANVNVIFHLLTFFIIFLSRF